MDNKFKGVLSFDRREHGTTSKVITSQLALTTSKKERVALKESEPFDWSEQELACARKFNFELPEDQAMAIQILEDAVQELTETKKSLILVFNEDSGTYTCLNDICHRHAKPRELTQISDCFLQQLLESDEVIHTLMTLNDNLMGIVAVADKKDGSHFTVWDDIRLELVARYLGTKILSFRNLQQTQALPIIQQAVLELSNRLIAAMNQETILKEILNIMGERLHFEVCQYVALDPTTGEGHVFYENRFGQLKSYLSEGTVKKQPIIKDFAALVSLFTSIARRNPYLHLTGEFLGDRSLQEMFGVKGVKSTLILPVLDATTGKLQGTFNLFKTDDYPIAPETLEISKEITILTSLALSRTKALERALAVASSDELTGLLNRRGFYERFEGEIERARRNPTSLCVVMIDVDHFKRLNDTYGHLNGDRVLQGISALLLRNVRKSDVVCRFGGEEFALLLPDTTAQSATELMDRIRRKIQKFRFTGTMDEPIQVTISAGIAHVNTSQGLSKSPKEVISDALALADKQLYIAKESGRNQVCANG